MSESPNDRHGSAECWQAMTPLRDEVILRVRRRIARPGEAEDAVHEAMMRLAARGLADLDARRLQALLARVACGIAIDCARRAQRERRLLPLIAATADTSPDELAADRGHARWLAGAANLGRMEKEALLHAAAGRRLDETAALLGVSYKAAESALHRARRKLRAIAATVSTGVAAILRRLRGGDGTGGAGAAASASLAVALLLFAPGAQQHALAGAPPRVHAAPGHTAVPSRAVAATLPVVPTAPQSRAATRAVATHAAATARPSPPAPSPSPSPTPLFQLPWQQQPGPQHQPQGRVSVPIVNAIPAVNWAPTALRGLTT